MTNLRFTAAVPVLMFRFDALLFPLHRLPGNAKFTVSLTWQEGV